LTGFYRCLSGCEIETGIEMGNRKCGGLSTKRMRSHVPLDLDVSAELPAK